VKAAGALLDGERLAEFLEAARHGVVVPVRFAVIVALAQVLGVVASADHALSITTGFVGVAG